MENNKKVKASRSVNPNTDRRQGTEIAGIDIYDKISLFNFGIHPIRVVVLEDGNPWFIASDVAKVLGYRDAPAMTRILYKSEMTTRNVCNRNGQRGGPQRISLINESGLYRCIFGSRHPKAIEFQNWVYTIVIPSIRQFGGYVLPGTFNAMHDNPVHGLVMASEIENFEKDMRDHHTEIINNQKAVPEKVMAKRTYDIDFNELYKIIRRDTPFTAGLAVMLEHLRYDGFLLSQPNNFNKPSQRSIDSGLMYLIHDKMHNIYMIRITPAGVSFFVDYFNKKMAR